MGQGSCREVSMRRVVHIITKLELGGAQKNTLYTLEHLEPGVTGILICGPGGILDKEALGSGRYITRFCPFLVREVNPLLDAAALLWIFFYLAGIKPGVIHTHSSKAGILGRWAAYFAGVKSVLHTFHGFGFTPLQSPPVRKAFILLEKLTAGITDILIAVAEANVDKALSLGIGSPAKYRVIRSGIESGKFEKKLGNDTIRKRFGISPRVLLVGNISCFKPQKGLEDFIEACRRLSLLGDYSFILAGDGRLGNRLRKQVYDSGLEGRLFMPGWVGNPGELIPELDLMLHTAYFEGLPRVLLEAMASGVPVVSSNVDGVADVIRHGVNGFLASPGDIDSMVKYSHNLLKNPELRARMSRQQRKSFRPEFDIKTMSGRLNALYREIEGL